MTLGFFETIFYMIWRGIAIGIIISAPMGPVGILCVQRTLEKGRRTGFFTGIGAAISDMIYCLLTGFGLSFIEDFLTRNHDLLQLIGSLVLIGFGIYLFKSNPTRNLRKPEEGISDKRNILNGFLFTFSNPLIIFLIIGLFARFEFLVPEIKFYHYFIGFISIGFGALLWWWIVTFFVAKLRSHFNLRSMWLINKIIGGIILIFALVGIVTAVKTMAKGGKRDPQTTGKQAIYLNSSRGFGSKAYSSQSGPLVIEPPSTDTVCRMVDIPEGVDSFEFSFRAANLHNASGKSYRDAAGNKLRHPGWGIAIGDKSGNTERILFYTTDNPKDELYSPTYVTVTRLPDRETTRVADGLDLFCGENSYHLSFCRGNISLFAGNREYKPIMSWDNALLNPDSIGFFVAPASRLTIDHIVLEWDDEDRHATRSEFGNPEVLNSYLLRSTDPIEGVWNIFDRSLEEDYLRLGGDYSFAMVSDGYGGYDLIYLSGARVEASGWIPGRIKARFIPTGFRNLYNVKWTDATGRTLPNEIRAEYEPGLFTLTFPYESSTLRLGKTKLRK